jgi:uncharacterized UPF0160 family protein
MGFITIATHNGKFHADDVFAVASLKILLAGNDIKIVRTRDKGVYNNADYVIDVGSIYDPETKRFDHHQKDGGAGKRENGVPYAAFGLVWKHYGNELAGHDRAALIIDEQLVQTIDAVDNGIGVCTVSALVKRYYSFMDMISAFRPTWNESGRSYDEAFLEAVDIAVRILEREIIHTRDGVIAYDILDGLYKAEADKRLLILDRNYPYNNFADDHPEILFVVRPYGGSEKWEIAAVRDLIGGFERRKDLPLNWAGKTDAELQDETGVDDAIFCHNNRFIAIAGSKEGAVRLAKKALQSETRKEKVFL